jgi:small-conductance mechanosensitive channel/CRP-like cAMP-binding protein
MGEALSAAMIVWPVALALGGCLLLLLIFIALRRSAQLRPPGPAYLLASLLFGLALLLRDVGPPNGWLRGTLLSALALLWGYVLFELTDDLLIERALRRRGVVVPRLARDIARAMLLLAIALVAASQIFGAPLNSLVISSTVASAVIGLALQDLLKDVVAGIALQADQPFGPGDWLLFGDQPARVLEMGWRATRMVTVDSTHLIVPNSGLAQAQITNYSTISPLQALHVQIPLSPDHPPNAVKQVLAAAALAAEGVLGEPAPAVRLIAYGEYSVTYDIKFWMRGFARYVETRDAVMTSAWYHARRAGFRQPTPLRELYLHESDPRRAADERASWLRECADALAGVDLFGGLSADERAALAARAERRIFGRGELLVRQGDLDDALFILRRGRVRIMAAGAPGSPPVTVGELAAGDFFGELAMLTGEPRRADALAVEDTEALLVRREAIGPLLERNPALAEGLSALLERRIAERQSILAEAAGAADAEQADVNRRGLLQRIRSLFGLG